MRGVFLSLREKEYVEAAKASGAGDARIMFRHILPNTLGPIVVNATLAVGTAILIEAALSFLGFGIKPPTPSLGVLVATAQNDPVAVVADGLPGPDDRRSSSSASTSSATASATRSTRSSGECVPEPVLSIRDLVVEFKTEDGIVHAVDGVSYDVFPGETLGIVGESGSGKSVSTLALLGLIPQPPGRIVSGTAMFKGRDLLKLKKRELRRVRGNEVAMVFQDPMTSLNPVLTVGSQLGEAIKTHYPNEKDDEVKERVIDLLRLVGVPNPETRYTQYPHEFSGGMRQRAMIAMAIANSPSLLIADEPTTALDVTIQAQVLEVLKRVQAETDAATILITHDLGIVAEMCDRVLVMYAGHIVESGDVETIFRAPRHPYTIGLMNSLPKLTEDEEWLRADHRRAAVADQPAAGLPVPSPLLPRARALHAGESRRSRRWTVVPGTRARVTSRRS